jgi:hypothetical protein
MVWAGLLRLNSGVGAQGQTMGTPITHNVIKRIKSHNQSI